MQSQTKVEHDVTIKFCLVEEKKGLPKLDTKLTDWYQKHWGVRLHAAKCNLGKVNLEVMLVESFSNYARGGQTPLAGAPCFLVVLRSVFTRFLLLAWHFGAVFFSPTLPLSLVQGQVSTGWEVFHWTVQCDSAWGVPLVGLPWIRPSLC